VQEGVADIAEMLAEGFGRDAKEEEKPAGQHLPLTLTLTLILILTLTLTLTLVLARTPNPNPPQTLTRTPTRWQGYVCQALC
jgi:hypothetical protein